MALTRTRSIFLLMLAFALALTVVGCGRDIAEDDDEPEEEPAPTEERYVTSESDPDAAHMNTNGQTYVIFSYEGESPSYHGALINSAPILLYGTGKDNAEGRSQRNYSETTSLGHPSSGTDKFSFNGDWDGTTLKGEILSSTDGTIDFAESDGENKFFYIMTGTLEATRVEGTNTLKGTVKGSSTLDQTMNGVEEEPTEATVVWTVTGEIQEP